MSQVKKEKFKTSGRSLAKEFNDVVAMDLKPFNNAHILHLIDLSTRYSNAVVIRSKYKDVIVKNILQHWIAVSGAPDKILSDNRDKFNNQELQDMSENDSRVFMVEWSMQTS